MSPGIREQWSAIGVYHRFLNDNRDIYKDAFSIAKAAILINENVFIPGDELHVRLLNVLAGAGLDFDVIFDRHLDHLDLDRYALIVLTDENYLSDANLLLA